MNPTYHYNTRCTGKSRAAAIALAASVILGAMLGNSSRADMYRPATNAPGGVVAQSTITSITPAGTNTTVCWYGMQGWYTVEMSTNNTPPWNSVGRTAASDHAWCLTVPNGGNTNAFFRLSQLNAYAGSGACAGCHGDKFSEYMGTEHASAFAAITNELTQTNELIYRTAGYGQPSGFVSSSTTPQLRNVGCENCHGPAAWHKYSDHDLIHPAVSIDPKICGGCHQGEEHPTYEEYETTLHAEVNGDIKYGNALPGVYFTNMLVIRGTNASGSLNIVAPGTAGSTNCYGYYVTTNADSTLKTNYTTGIIHSGNGPGSGYLYDPGQDRAVGCGICHSAANRMAQLNDYEARLEGRTNALQFAAAKDGAAWSAACATCHDPHSAEKPEQLRNPMWSSNYYTMPTTADKRTIRSTNFMGGVTTNVVFYSAAFANMYNPNIHVCGQCHNSRGARWDGRSFGYYNTNTLQSVTTNGLGIAWGVQTNVSFSRGPHHSVQYNVLIGIVQNDYLTTDSSGVATNFAARHGVGVSSSGSYNTNQCATCHVPVYTDSGTGAHITGHTFELDTKGCALGGCHLGGVPNIEEFQTTQTNGISRAVALLNQWAITYGTNIFGATNAGNYKENGWEYTTIGALATITNAGPSSGDQLKIPDAIKQARFNLYMVLNDGSMGVHNPGYVPFLISDATNKITSVISAGTNNAYFTANASKGYVPFAVTFTSWGSGITNYSWDFGDGNISSSANPTNTYTSRGTYTVTLTVTDNKGIVTTLTRSDYVGAYARPVPSFIADIRTGKAPLTVTFTNTSTGTDDVSNWRWTPKSSTNITNNNATFSYTYTAVGTNNVALRAYTPVGNITTTSNAYIIVTP